MFTNILIGVDGRDGGRDAIALARELAAPQARLTLGHVFEPHLARDSLMLVPLARDESELLLERERERAAVQAELVNVGVAPPARGLHELAERDHSDLLVVGASHRAALGRVVIGDDCLAALDGAPCGVAVAPRGYAKTTHQMARVGVGYDGSPESEQALTWARAIAARHAASITVFQVVSLAEVRGEDPIPAGWPRATKELVARHRAELAGLDGVRAVVRSGGPREELVLAGHDLDLLILGSRGYGPLGRLMHGSVSRFVVAHADCPVLVLPRGVATAQPFTGASDTASALPADDRVPA